MEREPRRFWRCAAGTKHYAMNIPPNVEPDTPFKMGCRCVKSFFKVYPDATSIWDLRSLGPGESDVVLYCQLETEELDEAPS